MRAAAIVIGIAVGVFGTYVWRVRYRALKHELERIGANVAELVRQGAERHRREHPEG